MKSFLIFNTVCVIVIIVLIAYQMSSMNTRLSKIEENIENVVVSESSQSSESSSHNTDMSYVKTQVDELHEALSGVGMESLTYKLQVLSDEVARQISDMYTNIDTKLDTIDASTEYSKGVIENQNENNFCNNACQQAISNQVKLDIPYDEMACKIFSANIFEAKGVGGVAKSAGDILSSSADGILPIRCKEQSEFVYPEIIQSQF